MQRLQPGTTAKAVVAHFSRQANPRLASVMATLIRHLHQAIIETEPTEEEWLAAVRFLNETGRMSSTARDEFMILSDTLGVSALVDAINHERFAASASDSTILGPFFVEGVKEQELGSTVCDLASGEATLVIGQVDDDRGAPVAGAMIDIWQTNGEGFYDSQLPSEGYDTRARFRSTANGSFWFRTVKPVSYPIPTDGPAGRLAIALGRPVIRPAHIHVMIRAEGYVPLTTHLFVKGDPHIGTDPVFGVKDTLIVPFCRVDDPREAAKWLLSAPFYRVRGTFRLQGANGAAETELLASSGGSNDE